MLTSQNTPLTSWHRAHQARMVDFAGFEMPIQYSSIVAEHLATRSSVGIFDISHMGRLRFEGVEASRLLDFLLTRRVTDMRPGMVRYSLMCNAEGGILDDVLVSCLKTPSDREFFLLVVNASNRAKILKWIQPHMAEFPGVEFADVTEDTAMIAVQGPFATNLIERLLPAKVLNLKYYRSIVTEQMSKPCIVSRTGYTGEDGFELIVRSQDALRVWENLLLAGREHGILPVGLGARDTLRLEAAMPLYGHELNEQIDPFTAGLGFAVNLEERIFLGASALSEKQNCAGNISRVGLRVTGRRPAREGCCLLDTEGNVVGEVTSGTFSPTLQYPIAMGYLSSALSRTGQVIEVDIRGSKTEAQVVELPF
ncbi:MAG: glycine cleavage system aminomethyltransferase GcvT, partial [Caldilineaceae bacterium]|nr:glycine cleavage system aminomethyltransferase GcvT [Caldilineaceae bacterium]